MGPAGGGGAEGGLSLYHAPGGLCDLESATPQLPQWPEDPDFPICCHFLVLVAQCRVLE